MAAFCEKQSDKKKLERFIRHDSAFCRRMTATRGFENDALVKRLAAELSLSRTLYHLLFNLSYPAPRFLTMQCHTSHLQKVQICVCFVTFACFVTFELKLSSAGEGVIRLHVQSVKLDENNSGI